MVQRQSLFPPTAPGMRTIYATAQLVRLPLILLTIPHQGLRDPPTCVTNAPSTAMLHTSTTHPIAQTILRHMARAQRRRQQWMQCALHVYPRPMQNAIRRAIRPMARARQEGCAEVPYCPAWSMRWSQVLQCPSAPQKLDQIRPPTNQRYRNALVHWQMP